MKSMGVCLLGVFLIIGFAACTDNFDALNTPDDRLVAEDLDASLLGQAFAQGQYFGMLGSPGPFQLKHSLFSDIYAQYFQTTHEAFDSDQFVEVGRWIDGAYGHLYASPAPQVTFVEEFTAEHGMALENAMAKVWKVQFFHRITDYWGPIIYSEFGSGETSVAYDSQQDIYANFFQLLEEAVAVFDQNRGGTSGPLAPHDLVFDGDVDKWRTYANSLRLRLAMRASYADPTLAQQQAEAAVASGVMTSNDENAMLLTTAASVNPYAIITQWGEYRMSATMESFIQGYNDPRAPEYFTPAEATGEFHGMRNGYPRGDKTRSGNNPRGSDMGTRWLPLAAGGQNYDITVLRAPEVYFLRAEGALRGWNMGGTAEEHYNEGIRMSLREYTDASDGEIEAYLNSPTIPAPFTSKVRSPDWDMPPVADIPVAWDATGDFERNLEQIISQKWLALYPDSPEAWAERRRTGYPVGYSIILSLNPDIAENELFRRMTFVDRERSDNTAATSAAEALLNGPDANTTRIWWDAKPLSDFPSIP